MSWLPLYPPVKASEKLANVLGRELAEDEEVVLPCC